MRTFSLDFDEAVEQKDQCEEKQDLDWLGDLSPELTTAKATRFITQTLIGLAILAGFLFLI